MKIEDYNKYYIQGSDHYLIPKDVFKELFNEMINWKEEAKELKKQLEEYKYSHSCSFVDTCKNVKIVNYNQQKEFIDYLENEINKIQEQIKNYDIWHEVGTDINFLILKKQFNIEILSKYKEIIGVPMAGLDALE